MEYNTSTQKGSLADSQSNLTHCDSHNLMSNAIKCEKNDVTTQAASSSVKPMNVLNCPYCGKIMTYQEYEQAEQEFRSIMQQEYRQRFDQYKKEFEEQTLEQERKHRLEIESIKKTQLQSH